MSKKLVTNVIYLVLAISVFAMITATVSFVFEAVTIGDIVKLGHTSGSYAKLVSYVRNTAISISIFTAVTLASYCFAYFTKSKKIFNCISAVLSLIVAAFCIAFVFDLRGIALKTTSDSIYSAASAYFGELITLAIAALVLCAFFTVVTVRAFKNSAPTEPEKEIAANKEEENNETV